MRLVEAIQQVTAGEAHDRFCEENDILPMHRVLAHQFLYGLPPDDRQGKITSETQALIKNVGLTGNGFYFIGSGGDGAVYGNGSKIIKLEKAKHPVLIALDALPEGLGSHVFANGECNGVCYTVCEQIDTRKECHLQEIIAHLFKIRRAGMVYADAKSCNFGYDAKGAVKALDLDHFGPYDPSAKEFERSIWLATQMSQHSSFPLLFADQENTYVMLGAKERHLQQKIFNALSALGIDCSAAEVIDIWLDATIDKCNSLIRIPRTQVEYGTPVQKETMYGYLNNALQNDCGIAPSSNAASQEFALRF